MERLPDLLGNDLGRRARHPLLSKRHFDKRHYEWIVSWPLLQQPGRLAFSFHPAWLDQPARHFAREVDCARRDSG
jgi:hypothetical protein